MADCELLWARRAFQEATCRRWRRKLPKNGPERLIRVRSIRKGRWRFTSGLTEAETQIIRIDTLDLIRVFTGPCAGNACRQLGAVSRQPPVDGCLAIGSPRDTEANLDVRSR